MGRWKADEVPGLGGGHLEADLRPIDPSIPDPLEALGLLGAGQDTHRDAQGPGRAGAGGLGAPRGRCRADENRRRDRGCDRLLHDRQAGQDPYRAQIGAGGNAVADDRGGAAKLGGKSSGDREKLRAVRPTTR